MKILLLFLISLPVYSNSFQLPDTGARFTLKINANELVYESESLRKKVSIKDCNLILAKQLNAEILKKLPTNFGTTGLKFLVDDKIFYLDQKSELSGMVTMMDARIHQFLLQENESCK